MIVGEQKPLEEIKRFLTDSEKVLVVGCGTCVTVCFAGGEKEAQVLASSLRMSTKLDGTAKEVTDVTVQRQCEWEYLDLIEKQVREADIIVSIACGIGVQAMAKHFPDKWIVPGLNTTFLGLPEEQGVWTEQCQACGNCVLAITGGICPIARCPKGILNGPCGGQVDGRCEVEGRCVWIEIYGRLKARKELEILWGLQKPR